MWHIHDAAHMAGLLNEMIRSSDGLWWENHICRLILFTDDRAVTISHLFATFVWNEKKTTFIASKVLFFFLI